MLLKSAAFGTLVYRLTLVGNLLRFFDRSWLVVSSFFPVSMLGTLGMKSLNDSEAPDFGSTTDFLFFVLAAAYPKLNQDIL